MSCVNSLSYRLIQIISFTLFICIPVKNSVLAMKRLNMSTNTAQQRLPKLIAFDLDGTIWSPDMYQLWGGGSPFTVFGDGTKKLLDRNGIPVKLLGISSQILQTLKTEEKWKDTITAWVSCTDEPDWAAECMNLFKVKELTNKPYSCPKMRLNA